MARLAPVLIRRSALPPRYGCLRGDRDAVEQCVSCGRLHYAGDPIEAHWLHLGRRTEEGVAAVAEHEEMFKVWTYAISNTPPNRSITGVALSRERAYSRLQSSDYR